MIEKREIPTVKASDIKEMFEKGLTRPEIAKALGISPSRLSKLVNSTPSLSHLRPTKNPIAFVDDLAIEQELPELTKPQEQEQVQIQD